MSESEQDAVRSLLSKIEKGLPEIKYRSIASLNSKVVLTKLLSIRELIEFYPETPGLLLNFINDYQTSAGKDVLMKTVQILQSYSSNDIGARLLNDYGALEFLCQYKDNIKDNEKLANGIENVLSNLVQARNFNKTQSSQSYSQTQSIPMLYSSDALNIKDLRPENKENISTQFSKITDLAQTKKAPEKSFTIDNEPSFTLGRSEAGKLFAGDKSFTADQSFIARQTVNLGGARPTQPSTYHMESEELQKLKANKEDFYNAVYVPLNEEDSKYIFDLTVQLKYGEQRTIFNMLTENLLTIIEDYPIESFLFQGELFGELFNLMKKSTMEIQLPLAKVYAKILQKMAKTFDLYANPHHKNKTQAKDCDEFIVSDDKLHVKNSYPTLNPPTAEIANDPTFKKHQKDNFQLTYFSVLDAIVSNITELLHKVEFNDSIYQIWTLAIKILTKFKIQAPELVTEAVKDYLRRFVKKFDEITENEFYGNIEFSHLPTILYNLFRIFTFEEYQGMEKFKSSQIVQILVKGVYKFSFAENEVEDILTYLKYLCPDLHSKHSKTMGLLASIIKLKEKETELVRARIQEYVKSSADLESLIELLEKLLVSIPHASFPNFVELYVDAFLFCQIHDSPNARDLYERSKALILHLLNIHTQSIRTILLDSFNTNLNSDAKFFSHHAQTKRVLTFQSLLDEELVQEMVFSGLGSEVGVNSTVKLLLNFAVLARENHIEKERLQHVINFTTLFYGITNNPNVSHESLKSANNLLWRIDVGALLKIFMSDLFSKNQKKRIAAYKTLTTPRFIKRLKTEQDTHHDALKGFEDMDKKLKDNRILIEDLEDVERDPLKIFLDSEMKTFMYKGNDVSIFDLDLNVSETYDDLENLLKISNDTTIEPSLRMSSLEQLSEYIDSLLKALGGFYGNKRAIDIARRIFQTCTGTFITYCYDNIFNPTYATRLLLVINKFLSCPKLPEELIASVVPIFDLNSKILEQHGTVIISALVLLAGERNEVVKYQALSYLNALVFHFDLPEDRLPSDFKKTYALTTIKNYSESFFVFPIFNGITYESPFKKIWKIYPLEDHAQYFIDQHLNNFEKLKDAHFSVQDDVIRSRCSDFIRKIREDFSTTNDTATLLTGAQRWTKVISILDLYLPPPLLEYDVFIALTKVFNSNLTFLGLRNNSNIYKVTAILEKLFKSDVIIREVNSSAKLLGSILEFVEFVSSTVLGPVYELQFESAREKLDIILSTLKIVTGLLKLSNKAKQTKIKNLLVKKIIKQNFITLLSKLASFFNNNEVLHLHIAKFCRQLFYIPEIYLVLDLEALITNIFDFMFQCAHLENFKNKGLERWFLKFFLDYSRLDDDPSKIPLKSLDKSLSKLSHVSKQHVVNASSIGWLLRIAEDRETFIRILAWNLISNLATVDNINSYQSSIESGLQVLYSTNESFGVVLNAIHFLNKAIDLFMNVSPFEEILATPATSGRNDDELLMSEGRVTVNANKPLNREGITKLFYRRNILSYLKVLLSNENSPPIYTCNLAALLRNVCLLSPQKSLPILSQLEFWDLLIEVINSKKIKANTLGKDLLSSGRTLYESLILVNNVAQFFIFAMSYDRQIGDYLIFCTKMIKVIFKWLKIITLTYEKPTLVENPANLFLVDSCAGTLVQLLNTSIFISADKTIVMANKLYEEKIEKGTKESKYNIYLIISNILNATKNDALLLSLFKLIGNILPQWKKGLSLVESQDKNGETLSESLILNLYSHYKLNDTLLSESKISSDEYQEVKNSMVACTCALLSSSNPAKIAFICSGFLGICLKTVSKSSEHMMLEDLNTSATPSKKTKANEHDLSVSIMMQSRFSQVPTTFQASHESIRNTLKILGYLFAEASVSNFRQNDLLVKLEEHIYNIFDNILKSWRLIVRKDELLEELLRALTNFVSNSQVGTLCALRIADPKNPILNDVVTLVTRFESTDKVTIRIGFQFLHDVAHSKEIRSALYKGKLIDLCIQKLTKIWNNRKDWTMNNFYINQILNLFLSLSFYKDSHTRIVTDAQLLEQCMDLAQKDEFRGKLAEKIWKLMSNLSYHKSVKSYFLKYEDIFAMALAALTLEGQSLKMKWIVTQFFVNIMYKCNAAVTLVKKEHIVDQFFYFKKEVERELDKLTFTNTEKEDSEETADLLKKLLDTLTKINLFMK